jgi:hypothetical protein
MSKRKALATTTAIAVVVAKARRRCWQYGVLVELWNGNIVRVAVLAPLVSERNNKT